MDARRAKSVELFIEDLNTLRLEAGNPPLRQLAELSGWQFSRNALDDHLSHRRVRLPPWELVAAYVTACHQAASATGLDARRLGTLNDWLQRYKAALRGDVAMSGPFLAANDGNAPGGDAGPPAAPGGYERVTTGLTPVPGSAVRHGQNPDPPDRTKRYALHSAGGASDPGLAAPAHDAHDGDDEVEIAPQGGGKWSVRWLHRQPRPRPAPNKTARDEEFTEPLSSSSGISPANGTDLAVSLAADTAVLLIKRGPYTGSQFVVRNERTTIGRDPASDVFLDDATVSRAHSVIYRRGGSFTIRDAGSLNSTFVNRIPVVEEFLTSGDELQVGVFRFLFLQGY